MGAAATRATIYLDPELHKALRLKAVETSQSLSKLVNDAIKESLSEDAEDIAIAQEYKATIWTQDSDFKNMSKVKYFPKK